LLVEVAEAVIFESGGAAPGAVDLEVSAAGDVQTEWASEFVGFGFLRRFIEQPGGFLTF
jgi:hypothetical protein